MSNDVSASMDRGHGVEPVQVGSATRIPDLAAFKDTTRPNYQCQMHPDMTQFQQESIGRVQEASIISSHPLNSDDAKWIGLTSIRYRDPGGRERLWESAGRKTKTSNTADAVGIVALLQYPSTHERGASGKGPYIVLQKQFRPAVGKVCVEIPAGLVDAGENVEAAALRELKEETGYVGEVFKPNVGTLTESTTFGTSVTMYNDPGFCQTSTQMVYVKIDMSIPENAKPKPELEDGEFIECFEVRMSELRRECKHLEEQGYAIDARVGGLAEGIECAKWFGLS